MKKFFIFNNWKHSLILNDLKNICNNSSLKGIFLGTFILLKKITLVRK